ncbi:MAG: hypothetical protein ACREP9_12955, partial [Candidatus Dormibacteraceae bacterium]
MPPSQCLTGTQVIRLIGKLQFVLDAVEAGGPEAGRAAWAAANLGKNEIRYVQSCSHFYRAWFFRGGHWLLWLLLPIPLFMSVPAVHHYSVFLFCLVMIGFTPYTVFSITIIGKLKTTFNEAWIGEDASKPKPVPWIRTDWKKPTMQAFAMWLLFFLFIALPAFSRHDTVDSNKDLVFGSMCGASEIVV